MNWDDLRYFLALCREGSVSQAGKSLGVNHTTVARRIAAFERNVGSRLFDRTQDGYAMTQAAEDILEQVHEIEDQTLAIERKIQGRDAALEGQLRLTATYDLAIALIIHRLPEFCRTYPGIDLELISSMQLIDLEARKADIAVRLTAKPPDYLVGRRLFPVEAGIYSTPEYLARCPKIPEVLLYRDGKASPAWMREALPGARVIMRTDSLTTQHNAVINGMGIAPFPCFYADRDPRLCRLNIEHEATGAYLWVLNHADLRATARVRACREFLIDILLDQEATILGTDSNYTDWIPPKP